MKKSIITLVIALVSLWSHLDAQKMALRTNLLGLATGNINIEGSMYITPNLTFHLPIQAKPFAYPLPAPIGLLRAMEELQIGPFINEFGTIAHTENATILPGIRYWWGGAYNRGLFAGVYAMGTWFRWGGTKMDANYREGFGIGGGFSLGYSYELTPRWNIEVEFGVGGLLRQYDYVHATTQKVLTNDKRDIIATFPKIGVSLVYILR